MQLHQLEYFVAVVETGGFSKAAVRCNITQPSLSQQIINLENELGRKLFDRIGRRVTVTAAGKLLYPRACAILSDVQQAKYMMTDGFESEAITLAVGIIPTLGASLLYPTVARFQKTYPNVRLEVREDVTEQLVNLLLDAELDVAFISLPIANNQIMTEILFEETLYLVLPDTHKLADAPTIASDLLQNTPFIRLTDRDCLSDQLDAFCYVQKINPPTIYQSSHLSTVLDMVRLGLGISLVPACSIHSYNNDGLVFLEISQTSVKRKIATARHQGREFTPLTTSFAHFLLQEWEDLTGI